MIKPFFLWCLLCVGTPFGKGRYGHNKTDLELIQLIDRDYLVTADAHVSLLTPEGVWAVTRHPLNQRGDEASIQQRQASVESVGIIKDVRGDCRTQARRQTKTATTMATMRSPTIINIQNKQAMTHMG